MSQETQTNETKQQAKTPLLDNELKVYNSYESALDADKFEASSDYNRGVEMAIGAIFDNLSGYQCRDLMTTLTKNGMGEHVPYHIIYKLVKNFKMAINRKDQTAYLTIVKENSNER